MLEKVLNVLSTSTSTPYRYPDPLRGPDDSAFPYPKRAEEHEVLTAALAHVQRCHLALDAGCGLGVHIASLLGCADGVLAIDAEEARVTYAHEHHGAPRVACRTMRVDDDAFLSPALRGAFGLVHCMQVLGHVPHETARKAMAVFAHLLSPAGTLIVGVPSTTQHHDDLHAFVRLLGGGGTIEEPLNVERFDALARNPPERVLAVRHFGASLSEMLASAGFSEIERLHYNRRSERHRDVVVIAARSHPGPGR